MCNTEIQEVNGGRRFLIENDNEQCPSSVFMVEQGGLGVVMEFNRTEIIASLKLVYDLHENWDAGLAKLLVA